MKSMVSFDEPAAVLRELGARVRAARLLRNDGMDVFAQRIAVSVPTLRAIEQGIPTVQIGSWLNALWALDRLDDLKSVLEPRASLLERARLARQPLRQRARRRPS